MSFFSKSSRGNHYKKGDHGSNHYQKKGLFGNLLDIIGSRSRSSGHYNKYGNQNYDAPVQHQPKTSGNATTCSKCNSSIPMGSKFCLQCGEKVNNVLFCSNCGERLPSDAKFCLKCGTRVNG